MMQRLLGLAVTIATAGAQPAGRPVTFPTFPLDSATPLLIVGEVVAGQYLPQFGECASTEVICMDPPPFWIEVRSKSTVYGPRISGPVAAATTSHYGMPNVTSYSGKVFLLSLLTDGTHFVMPRYGMVELVADRRGKHHALVLDEQPPYWLPCATWQLQKPLHAEDFNKQDLMLVDDDARHRPAQLLRKVRGGWIPRSTVPVDDMAAHLAQTKPSSTQMKCESEERHEI